MLGYLSAESAIDFYQELVAGERMQLPSGFWRVLGRDGAAKLLRHVLLVIRGMTEEEICDRFNRRLLIDLGLNGGACVLFNNCHFDFLLHAFPGFRHVPMRFRRDQISKDEEYFDKITTERRAYLLGLLVTDGNVTDGNQVSLWLKRRDEEAIDLLAEELRLEPYRKKWRKRDDTVGLVVCSARLARGLARHGVVPRKSKVILWPETVPPHLLRHFVRGLMDGDGSINQHQWTFVSGSREFVNRFREVVASRVGRTPPVNSLANGHAWLVSGGHWAWTFLDWVYRDATCYLSRKHGEYTKVYSLVRVQALNPLDVRRVRRTGRRGFSAEVDCSLCGVAVRRTLSSLKKARHVFCRKCSRDRSRIQQLMKNQQLLR